MASRLAHGLVVAVLLCGVSVPPLVAAEDASPSTARRDYMLHGNLISSREPVVGTAVASCDPFKFCDEFYVTSVAPPLAPCVGPSAFASTTTITYRMLSQPGNVPIPNCPVAVELYAQQRSRGHCHVDANRPTGSPAPGQVVSGNTGPDGNAFQVAHAWPDVAGRINVLFYSTSPSCPFYNDRDTAFVWCVWNKNGPLQDLGTGQGYEQVGGPDNVAT